MGYRFIDSKSQLTASNIDIPEGLFDALYIRCYGTHASNTGLITHVGSIRLELDSKPKCNADFENLYKFSLYDWGLPVKTEATTYAFCAILPLSKRRTKNSVYITDADHGKLYFNAFGIAMTSATIEVYGITGNFPTRYVLHTFDDTISMGALKPWRLANRNIVSILFNHPATTDPTSILVTKDGIVSDHVGFTPGLQITDLVGEIEAASLDAVVADLAPSRLMQELFSNKVEVTFDGGSGDMVTTRQYCEFDSNRLALSRIYLEKARTLSGVASGFLTPEEIADIAPSVALRPAPPTVTPAPTPFRRAPVSIF